MMSLIEGVEVSAISATLNKITTFQSLIQRSLKEGQDYGKIPGTNKPTLLKPGGEKISMMMGLVPEYEFLKVDEDFEKGFFNYNIKCQLYRNQYKVSEGIGSCNSKETKYRYIWVPDNEVPNHLDKESLKTSERYGSTQYRIENPEIYSLANTILKMGKKRAFIDAILQVASLSEIFTQDLEDLEQFTQSEKIETLNEKDAENMKVTFGKYKGKTLGEILEIDDGYLAWISDKGRDEVMRKAATMLLNPSSNASKVNNLTQGKDHPDNTPDVDTETGEMHDIPEEFKEAGDLPF